MPHLKKQIESIQVCKMVYYDATKDLTNNSYFDPGSSPNNTSLLILLKTDVEFPEGTVFRLRLVGTINNDGIKTNIKKIKVKKTLKSASKVIELRLVDKNIPIPSGIVFIPTSEIADCQPITVVGNALEYCLLLDIKLNNRHLSDRCPKLPLICRYIGSQALCDIKCEKVECISGDDPDYPIKITCQDNTLASCRMIHCVTHCQAPRPIVYYYDIANKNARNIDQESKCSNC